HHTVAVPPLDHRVGGAGIGRIGLHESHRHQRMVDHMNHAGNDDEGTEEPVTDVDVADVATRDGAEKQERIAQPDQGDPDSDGPLHLRVLLGGRVAQPVADYHGQTSRLPAPEHELANVIGNQPYAAGAL